MSKKKPNIEDKELERDLLNLNIPLDDQMFLPATDAEVIRAYGEEEAREMGLLSGNKKDNG